MKFHTLAAFQARLAPVVRVVRRAELAGKRGRQGNERYLPESKAAGVQLSACQRPFVYVRTWLESNTPRLYGACERLQRRLASVEGSINVAGCTSNYTLIPFGIESMTFVRFDAEIDTYPFALPLRSSTILSDSSSSSPGHRHSIPS